MRSQSRPTLALPGPQTRIRDFGIVALQKSCGQKLVEIDYVPDLALTVEKSGADDVSLAARISDVGTIGGQKSFMRQPLLESGADAAATTDTNCAF